MSDPARKRVAEFKSFALMVFAVAVWHCLHALAHGSRPLFFVGAVALGLGWPHRWLEQHLAGDGA